MIKIENVKDTERSHYEICGEYTLARLKFYIAFYEGILLRKKYDRGKRESFTSVFKIDPRSLNYLCKTKLKKKWLKGKNGKSRTDLLQSFLFRGERYMLNLEPSKDAQVYDFLKIIEDNFIKIFRGEPSALTFYTSTNWREKQEKYKELIDSIFVYARLSERGFKFGESERWTSYSLTSSLRVQVCPYCNKNWINTVYDKEGREGD